MKETKQRQIITIVMIIAAIISVSIASYAAFTYNFEGEESQINKEQIKLELLESTSEIINIENALPMSDKDGKVQTETFNFSVTTTTKSNAEIGYSLKIEKLEVDENYTALTDDQIKIYLTDYNNRELLQPTKINSLNNYVFYSKTNTHNSNTEQIQDKYKLRVWIDKDTNINSWNENTKMQYKFKIGVTDKQEQTSASKAVYSFVQSAGTLLHVEVGDTLESIPGYTEDYTTLNNDFFLKHNIDSNNTVESNELCYILNNKLYCLKASSQNYYEENKSTLSISFGEENCYIQTTGTQLKGCTLTNISAEATLAGALKASNSTYECSINEDEVANCNRYGK